MEHRGKFASKGTREIRGANETRRQVEESRQKRKGKKMRKEQERRGEAEALYSFSFNLWCYKKGHFLKNLYRKISAKSFHHSLCPNCSHM